jgi:hypothetical protein
VRRHRRVPVRARSQFRQQRQRPLVALLPPAPASSDSSTVSCAAPASTVSARFRPTGSSARSAGRAAPTAAAVSARKSSGRSRSRIAASGGPADALCSPSWRRPARGIAARP